MFPYLDPGHNIPVYGVMIMLAIAVCFALLIFLKFPDSLSRQDRVYGGSFALIAGIFGAKLLSVLTSINLIVQYKPSLVDIIKNGFVFYGGLIGGAAGLIIYCKMYKISVVKFFDVAAVILPIGQAIGRIGCLAAGCCYGRPTDSFLGIVYEHPADPTTPVGVPLLPTQVFETAYCTALFIALLLLSRKKRRDGFLVCVYAAGYAAARFINEFFRYDAARGFFLGLSTSQIISVGVLLCVLAFLVYNAVKSRRRIAGSGAN